MCFDGVNELQSAAASMKVHIYLEMKVFLYIAVIIIQIVSEIYIYEIQPSGVKKES